MTTALRIGAVLAFVAVAIGAPFTGLAVAGVLMLLDKVGG